jgi:hypothetical protein
MGLRSWTNKDEENYRLFQRQKEDAVKLGMEKIEETEIPEDAKRALIDRINDAVQKIATI